ncbi:MAG: ion transporter [Oscillatoriales cyanobacterium]|nr:MAG: ion transporter [Oscillatoriales cyanobacterium]
MTAIESPSHLSSLQQRASVILDGLETPASRWVNGIIAVSILLSAVTFVIETFPINDDLRAWLTLGNRALAAVFAVEYAVRFWCAEQKLRYIFSLYSVIDAIAIAPLLLGVWDVRFLRLLRWFRVLRLVRFLDRRYIPQWLAADDRLIITRILFTLFSIVFIYSGLIYQVEHPKNSEVIENFLDAFYFAVVTMTTVGYGDITPVSKAGKLVTVLMILSGIAVIPWQISDLIKSFVNTNDKIRNACDRCGLIFHDPDASYCRRCGASLPSSADDIADL